MKLLIAFIGFTFLSIGIPSIPNKGSEAPDFEIISNKGKKIKLSKLRGTVVLIDFWASWCGPCRKENPNVVEVYNKYHSSKFKTGKGFEVLSVSLDRLEEPWHKAIIDDKLDWKYHGWDKGGAVSKLYNVASIPTAYLIDGDGKIVAFGNEIRGLGLHIALDQLLAE